MNITRMIQLSLGVPDAVPAERRQDMALLRLAELAIDNEQLKQLKYPWWEYKHADSEPRAILKAIADAYTDGALDQLLTGLSHPELSRGTPAATIVVSRTSLIGTEAAAGRIFADAVLTELARWAQANLRLDDL